MARAAAESIAFQVQDVFEIILKNSGHGIGKLFVDGGPSQNPFLMGMVADLIDHSVIPGESTEASAQGAAYLAGLATGFWTDLNAISAMGQHGQEIAPSMAEERRKEELAKWQVAIERTLL